MKDLPESLILYIENETNMRMQMKSLPSILTVLTFSVLYNTMFQQNLFYKNIFTHNANPDHDMKKMQTLSQQLFVVVTEQKKNFCPFVPQCNYHIFAQYDIFISCKCHFGGIVRGVFEISNS